MNVQISQQPTDMAAHSPDSPAVSIVIPTRNRPQYLARLLACVQEQDLQDFECIVVDDGSSEETTAAYDGIWHNLDSRFQLHLREGAREGLGPSKMRNKGIKLARGMYVALCDDDDLWIAKDHLSTAARLMAQHGADLYFANMQYSSNGVVNNPDHYAAVMKALTSHRVDGAADVFEVSQRGMAAVLRHRTLHSNTIVASRKTLLDTGLYWEKTNFAEDRDMGFRLFDSAHKTLFRSTAVAQVDVSPHTSLYRSFAREEKALFGILTTLHSETVVQNPALRRIARAVRAWDTLELARVAAAGGRMGQARAFAFESFLLHPTAAALGTLFESIFRRPARAAAESRVEDELEPR